MVRALTVYLAAAWVVAQVVGEVVVPSFGLAESAVRWVVIATMLGLPVVLVLAWVYDLSPTAADGEPDETRPDTGPQEASPPTREPWFSPRAAILVVVLLLAGAALGWLARPAGPAPDGRPTLAVLPFEPLTGEADRYLSDGLTEDVVVALQDAGPFAIIGRTSTERFRDAAATPAEVAAALGARYVLTGSVRRAGDQLRVSVQLTDGATSRDMWAEQYDQPFTVEDVFSMYSDVARSVAASLRSELDAGAEDRLSERPTESAAAYQLYWRGRSEWSRRLPELMGRAIEFFDRAIAADPTFARAHAGRADALILEAFYHPGEEGRAALDEAQRSARRALELDPGLAEAHASLGYTYWLADWDWEAAEGELRRALELNPDYATAHHWLGDLLGQSLRTDEALARFERALELDPYAPAFHFDLAKALYFDERYEEALGAFERAIEIEPTYLGVTYGLHANALIGAGRIEDAIDLFARGTELMLGPELAEQGRQAYARGGLAAWRQQGLDELLAAGPDEVDPFFLGSALVGVGRYEEALDVFADGVAEHSFFSITLYASPEIRTALIDDPRYRALVRAIGLDPDALF